MTGMEHAIEQAARVLIAHPSIPNHKDAIRDVCPSCPDADVAGPNSPSHAAHQARVLAEAGLLAPAPLTEVRADAWVDDDPAVLVVRESHVARVQEVLRPSDDGGWRIGESSFAKVKTPAEARDMARRIGRNIAVYEAIARHLEARNAGA